MTFTKSKQRTGPKQSKRPLPYDEGVDEPAKLIEDEPVEIEEDAPAVGNESVERIEDGDLDPPVFEE
jgi:hypothetical protein